MTPVAALLAGAALAAWAAPAALHRLAKHHDPRAVMICWLSSIIGVLATFTVGAGLLLLPGDRPTGSIADLAHICWTALSHGRAPALDEGLGAAGALLLIVVLSRFARAAARRVRSQRRTHRAHMNLLTILQGAHCGPHPMLWLNRPVPLAYSVGGRPGLVVATSGLRGLPDDQLAAVLCHERAHLRGHHHLLVSLAEALAAALPVVPLFAAAPAAIRLLVEQAADDVAAREHGRPAVRAALLALDSGPAPDNALGVADHEVASRLERLAAPGQPGGTMPQTVFGITAVIAAAALPAMFGLAAVLLAVAISCPTT